MSGKKKTLVKKKNVGFCLELYLRKNLVIIKNHRIWDNVFYVEHLSDKKNAGGEKNGGFFLNIYLCKNMVIIKKSLHIGPRILCTDMW